jgi:hypothetical protein
MLDRASLEEVLHDVRSSADGFNKAMFGRVVQVAASNGPSVLPVDAFSVWHIQVGVAACFFQVDTAVPRPAARGRCACSLLVGFWGAGVRVEWGEVEGRGRRTPPGACFPMS